MGLLDFLGSDDAKLGLGLLAAGGASATPLDTWQRVQGAMQGMEADKANKLRLALLQSQIDENSSQAELRKAQVAQRQWAQGLTSGLLGDPSGGTSMGGGSNVAPSGGNAGLRGVPVERIAAIKAAGGPDLLEAWKTVNVPTSLAAGSYAFTPGQAPTYMASPDKGVGIGPQGVYALPGAAEAQAALARPIERAKAEEGARFQEATPTYAPDGSKTIRSRLEQYGGGAARTGDPYLNAVIATESGGNPNAVSPKGARGLMQVMPGTNTAPGFGVSPARDGSETERTRVGQEYLGKMQERYQDPTLAAIAYNWGPGNTDMWLKGGGDYSKLPKETRDYVASVMTRTAVGSRAPAGNVVELSPAEQTANKAAEIRAVESAKADVVRDTGKQTQGKSATQALETVQRARELLQAGPTASGIGRMADTAMNFVGQNTKGAETSAALDVVAGDLLRSIPRMEGPQSDKDVENYKIQAGRVSDRDTPVPQRLAALKEVERLNLKYASLNGGASNTGGAAGSGEPAKPQEKPPTPMKGMTMDGYKFKGGNPADPNNWTKL